MTSTTCRSSRTTCRCSRSTGSAADVGQSLGVAPDAVLIALGGIGLAVTLYAVHVLVVRMAGRGPALVAQLVTIALVGLSPWLSVPYTDVLAMPFVVGGAALASRALTPGRRRSRRCCGHSASRALAVAYAVKTTPVVVVAAAAITAAHRGVRRERHRGGPYWVSAHALRASWCSWSSPSRCRPHRTTLPGSTPGPAAQRLADPAVVGRERRRPRPSRCRWSPATATYVRAMVDAVDGAPRTRMNELCPRLPRRAVAGAWAGRHGGVLCQQAGLELGGRDVLGVGGRRRLAPRQTGAGDRRDGCGPRPQRIQRSVVTSSALSSPRGSGSPC